MMTATATLPRAPRLERLTRAEREELASLLEERDRRQRLGIGTYYKPYPWQERFFTLGSAHRIRGLMAANQVGKTKTGAHELAYHLTGEYPAWWKGRRFDHPVNAWAGTDTSETCRDKLQRDLIGPPELRQQWGMGLIPAKALDLRTRTMKVGVPNAIASILIHHTSGGKSRLTFKSYDQGRERWQAQGVDLVWLDEEPPGDIYSEALTRTVATDGAVMLTFTPLLGMSDVVLGFVEPPSDGSATGQALVTATWDDAPHLDATAKKELWAALRPHEREARSRGIPVMGTGRIYPIAEERITVDPFQIPKHWPRIAGMDVGWNRTAALWAAWDRESDIVYLYSAHYEGEALPAVHAQAVLARGRWIPIEIDPASRGRNQNDGETLLGQYRALGLKLTPANNAVEAGIQECLTRLETGRLKIFKTLKPFFDEFRLYHRDDKGKVVKARDHLMDCMRYLALGLKNAITEPAQYAPMSSREADGDGIYW